MKNAPLSERSRVGIFLIASFLILICFLPFYDRAKRAMNTNAVIRAYLTMALVDNMTAQVDQQVAEYGMPLDRAEKNGHIYSDKAPGLSFLAIPSYVMIRLVTRLITVRVPFDVVVYVMRISTVGIATIVLLYFMLNLLRGCVDTDLAYFCTAIYLLGTIAFPMSTDFLGHQVAAAFSFLAYYMLRRGMSDLRSVLIFCSGLFAGLSIMTEYPTVLIAAALFFLLWAGRPALSLPMSFVIGLAPPIAILMFYHRFAFGNFLDLGYGHTQHYFKILGIDTTGMGAALAVPSLHTLWQMAFSSYRGFFFFSPVMLFVLYGLWLLSRNGRRAESLMLAALAVGYFMLNAFMRDWEGGWSPGLRHLTPVVPLLILPLALSAQKIARMPEKGSLKKLLGVIFCAASFISVMQHTLIEATYLYFPWGVYHPLRDVCITFLTGGAWLCTLPSLLGAPDPVGPLLLVAGIAAFLWCFCRNGFAQLAPTRGTMWGTALVLVAWMGCILLLPPARTIQGDRFLALIYWNNALPSRFLDASRRIIEESPDREEKLRYARQSIFTAYEIMNEPQRALWFYNAYTALGGDVGGPRR
ncbi:MAG: hypothetical protein NTZ78_09520 [Candidatus Aureabacteria bacterium]|nr:hypothetical protein [Candidatus Auribacterota bacterium]